MAGRTVFPVLTSPHGRNLVFEVIVHPLVHGLLLVPLLVGWRPARPVAG